MTDDTARFENLFAGNGEMATLMRSLDWSTTPVGPVSGWSQSLRTAVSICLGSRHPIEIWWGPEYLRFYNDAYRPILGASKHPQFLGCPGRECWSEIWDVVGPMLDSVMATGIPTWSEDFPLMITRNGYLEETYFTFSYSPIRDESGNIGGIFSACSETTERVLGERRLRTLRELAARTAEAKTVEEACRIATKTLSSNPADIPLALLYLVEADGKQARLVGTTAGIAAGTPASPQQVDLTKPELEAETWPLALVKRTGKAELVDNLTIRFGALSGETWPESPHSAIIMPITQSGHPQQLAGLLVAGISSRREFDDEYKGFFDLVVSNVATAIANADAYEAERKRAEALAELDRAKTAFFSNVSHEFRTPLTLMLGPAEDALADVEAPLPPPQRERIEVLQRNGLRLLKLVNTLLDFSRIEAGRVKAVYEPTELSNFTIELASVFRSTIERAGLRLVVDCPPLPESVYIDRDMWEKIVLNLLSNAFKFTFEGEITVRLRWAGNYIQLEVQDTGTGIPAQELPRLFERFYRVEGARGRTHEGSGIGLALVQELVRLHGGTVEVTSLFGIGTTFSVKLPSGPAHLSTEQIGAARTLASTALGAAPYVEEAWRWLPDDTVVDGLPVGSIDKLSVASTDNFLGQSVSHRQIVATGARILLADDNADMREYLKRLLSQYWVVEAVADGAAALAAIRQQLPDLVLTDVMMPDIDGFKLLRQLRADPRTREVPIVLLSARAGEESRVEGLEAGADDYLIKPFSARELLARIRANLELAQVRKQAAVALRQSEERFRQLAENIQDVFWILEPMQPQLLYVSPAYEKLWGHSCSSLQTNFMQWFDSIHPEDRDRVQTAFFSSALQGEYDQEYRIVRPDRSMRWIRDRGFPVKNELGEVYRVAGIAEDITERKVVEQRQRFLLQLNDAIRFIQDPKEIMWEVACMAGKHFQVTRSTYGEIDSTQEYVIVERDFCDGVVSVVGKHHMDSFGPEIITELKQGRTLVVRDVLLDPRTAAVGVDAFSGIETRAVLCVPLVKAGRFVALFVLHHAYPRHWSNDDVALMEQVAERTWLAVERAQAEQALRESEARLRLALQVGRMGTWDWDMQTDTVTWSEGHFTILGLLPFECQPSYQLWVSSIHPEDLAGVEAAIQQAMKTKTEYHHEYRTVWPDGSVHWTEARGQFSYDPQGQPKQMIGVIIDISERKSVEQEREQLLERERVARNQAETANRIKDEFLAVLSHELRTPLNPILGWVQLLQTRQMNDKTVARALETIERNAKLQTQLIEDLLDVSRILRGKLSLNIGAVNLDTTIMAALETVRLAAEAKSIQIQTLLAPNIGQVVGDCVRLQQVIWNLLSNAVKFTPAGGRVQVRLERVRKEAQIQVSDTGIGIDPDFLPYVFEYFRQENGTTTRTFGGLGLGLAICRHLIELHGGTISVASPGADQGAPFTVKLPLLAATPELALDNSQPDCLPDLSGMRILVVNDEADMRELLTFLLEEYGAMVTAVTSAMEAREVLMHSKPDLLLCDIGMPEEDGYMLLRQVRTWLPEQGGQIPAIALTAYAAEADYNQALAVGFQMHITKPVESATLVAKIAQIAGRNSS